MRIFRFVFSGLAVAIILSTLVWFGYEKVLIGMAAYTLRNDMAALKRFRVTAESKNPCENVTDGTGIIAGYQLRFVSDTDYQLETVCDSIEAPIISKSFSLKNGVKRLYGSGVMLPAKPENGEIINGWVHLIMGKTIVAVGYFDNDIRVEWNSQELSIGGENPAQGSCNDWGFFCCKSQSEIGEGASVGTRDCQSSCFETCNHRPVTIYFNTNPKMDPKSRVLRLYSSVSTIKFGYEINDFDGEVGDVELDFGDGETSGIVTSHESAITHEYSCSKARCVYRAELKLGQTDTPLLMDSELNTITVILEP